MCIRDSAHTDQPTHVGAGLRPVSYTHLDVYKRQTFKIDKALPVEELVALRETFCPQEAAAMRQAAAVIVDFYRELAVPLAEANGIPYPADLERIMLARLEQLSAAAAADEGT